MSDDQRKHTVTFKGASMEDPWLVLGGDDIEELRRVVVLALGLDLSEASNLGELMAEAAVTYRGQLNVAKGLGGVAAAPQGGGYSAPQQQAAPQGGGGYQQAPQGGGRSGDKVKEGGSPAPGGPRPSCAHGERVWISGQGKNGKQYRMWACPSSDRNAQCDAVWA